MWLLEQTEGRGLTEQIDANGGFTPINRAASPRSPWPGVAPAGVRSALFSIIHSAYTPFIQMRAPLSLDFLSPTAPERAATALAPRNLPLRLRPWEGCPRVSWEVGKFQSQD